MHFHPHYWGRCPVITKSVQEEGGREGGLAGRKWNRRRVREREKTKPEAYCIKADQNAFTCRCVLPYKKAREQERVVPAQLWGKSDPIDEFKYDYFSAIMCALCCVITEIQVTHPPEAMSWAGANAVFENTRKRPYLLISFLKTHWRGVLWETHIQLRHFILLSPITHYPAELLLCDIKINSSYRGWGQRWQQAVSQDCSSVEGTVVWLSLLHTLKCNLPVLKVEQGGFTALPSG